VKSGKIEIIAMEKELSLFCKNKHTEKFLNFKVLKTIGKVKSSGREAGKGLFARGKQFKGP
jgi:hypothetical protein